MNVADAIDMLGKAINLSREAGSLPDRLELVTIARSQAIEVRDLLGRVASLIVMVELGQAKPGSTSNLFGDRPYTPNVTAPRRVTSRSRLKRK